MERKSFSLLIWVFCVILVESSDICCACFSLAKQYFSVTDVKALRGLSITFCCEIFLALLLIYVPCSLFSWTINLFMENFPRHRFQLHYHANARFSVHYDFINFYGKTEGKVLNLCIFPCLSLLFIQIIG